MKLTYEEARKLFDLLEDGVEYWRRHVEDEEDKALKEAFKEFADDRAAFVAMLRQRIL